MSGDVTLSAKQAAAFRTGKLYVQIDSQKAPDGTVWGWLLPDHPIMGADVPQQGHWFIRHSSIRRRAERNREDRESTICRAC